MEFFRLKGLAYACEGVPEFCWAASPGPTRREVFAMSGPCTVFLHHQSVDLREEDD